jgi:hypothetical protein
MNTAPATHLMNPRALARWRNERLTLETQPDGGVRAAFRFDGSTCGNIPLTMIYTVEVGPASAGYVIRAMGCAPAPGDVGHIKMCSYVESAGRILVTADAEKPLLGQPLGAVLGWKPLLSPAGCLCAAASRNHKWSAVLQTLHLALPPAPLNL